jgi:hypothetical protein
LKVVFTKQWVLCIACSPGLAQPAYRQAVSNKGKNGGLIPGNEKI